MTDSDGQDLPSNALSTWIFKSCTRPPISLALCDVHSFNSRPNSHTSFVSLSHSLSLVLMPFFKNLAIREKMVHGKALLVVLTTAAIVVASPCKPSTIGPVLSTATTTIEQVSSTTTSVVGVSTVLETATESTTVAMTTTTAADTTATPSTTQAVVTTTTAVAETTTAVAETTSTIPGAAAPTACGIYGYFVEGNTLSYITSPGTKDNAKDCLQACADYPECEVVDFYNEAANGYEKSTCEFWKGTIKTDGSQTPYQWFQVSCLASM